MTIRTVASRGSALALIFVGTVLACGQEASEARLGPVDGRGLPATDLDRVSVGDSAPDFSLRSLTGAVHTLSQYRGSKNVVLVFYRGHW